MYLRAIFARQGRLDIVVSDNGPQVSGYEVKQCTVKYGFGIALLVSFFPSPVG